MINFQGGKAEVCIIQPIRSNPPKLVLTRLAFTLNKNYNALSHNYRGFSPLLQIEIVELTQSGKCFTPEELEKQRKAKGKEVMKAIRGIEVNKPISEEEAGEFLKLMKHNKYSVVEQLKKTPGRISLMSLILSFELYRNTL
jgi:hypothetical protein